MVTVAAIDIGIRLAQLAISGATTLAEAHIRAQILAVNLRSMGVVDRMPTEAEWTQLAIQTDAAFEIGHRRAREAQDFIAD